MFKLKIKLGNAAMQYQQDVAGALYRLAERLENYEIMISKDKNVRTGGTIFDLNGNRVGEWVWDEREEDDANAD